MQDAPSEFQIRRATPADADTIALHRVSMFLDMGSITAENAGALRNATREYMLRAVPAGEYLGWVMYKTDEPDVVVGGTGLLLRKIPPFPIMHGVHAGNVAEGRQGLVMNVFVDRAFRRKGIAATLMRAVVDYANETGVESLVLHASSEGRPLYEQLGFISTNEMRLVPT